MKGIQVLTNEGLRPFPRGDNYEMAKIHWWNLKKNIFFSRTSRPILTKLGTKYRWLKGIQFCSNKGSFPRGDITKLLKNIDKILKISFSRTNGPISMKLIPKQPFVKGTQGLTNKDHSVIKKEMIWFFSHQINIMI